MINNKTTKQKNNNKAKNIKEIEQVNINLTAAEARNLSNSYTKEQEFESIMQKIMLRAQLGFTNLLVPEVNNLSYIHDALIARKYNVLISTIKTINIVW